MQRSDEGKSYNAIFVIVNRFSKMTRYIPFYDIRDATKLASVLVHKLILQGVRVPSSIVSNQGPLFTLKFWSALYYHLKIK